MTKRRDSRRPEAFSSAETTRRPSHTPFTSGVSFCAGANKTSGAHPGCNDVINQRTAPADGAALRTFSGGHGHARPSVHPGASHVTIRDASRRVTHVTPLSAP